jgi:predicted ATPase
MPGTNAPAPHAVAACWQLQVLNDVQLHAPGGRAVPLPGRLAAQLLARLALPVQRAWSREELVEQLWPGADPVPARKRLRQLLSELRSTFLAAGADLPWQADRDAIRLRPGALRCDAEDPTAPGELLPGHHAEWVTELRRTRDAARQPTQAQGARSTLPHPLTPWRGPARWCEQLRSLVRERRLVTITGPGGSGKTRLMLEAAHALQAEFEHVVWVPLAACRTAPALLEQLVAALGLPPAVDPNPALRAALADRRVLLLLDNLEQLPGAATALLGALAVTVPTLHLLASSRRPLALDGEHLFELPSLGCPSPHDDLATLARHPAMALLLDRAQAVKSGFRLDRHNAAALVALLQRLDSLPLALELAAPRLRSLSPQALLAQLQDPARALTLLERDGPRNGHDPRHASMLHTLRWSLALLSPPARALLEAVSVFDGPFDEAAATALHGAPAALALDELVAHALLRSEPGRWPYALHPLTREAVQQGLASPRRAALRSALRRWAADWAAMLPSRAPLPEVRQALPNVVAALAAAETDGDPAAAIALLTALQRALSDMPLPASARATLLRCATRLERPDERAVARATLARAALRAGDGPLALQTAALALQELPAAGLPRATVLARVAHLRWRLQRDPTVAPWLDEALALARAHGDQALAASVLSTQGALLRDSDAAQAAARHRAAIAAWRAAGDVHGMLTGRYNLAIALGTWSQTRAEALREIDAVITATRDLGDWGLLGAAWNQRGDLMRAARRWDEAVAAYRTALRVADDSFDRLILDYALWNLPLALVRRRQARAAATLMGFSVRQWTLRMGPLNAADERDSQRLQRLAARLMGTPAAESAWREGQALGLGAALRLALGSDALP